MVIVPVVVSGSISVLAICGVFAFDALKNWSPRDAASAAAKWLS